MCRHLFGTAIAILLALPSLTNSALAEAMPVRIVLFGDSYISSYGVDTKDGFAVRLEAALKADGLSALVVDTGYTATAFEGARRMDSLFNGTVFLGGSGPKAVILELGSNDCRRYRLEETQASLETILQAMADRHIPVLVAGTTAYDTCPKKDRPNYKERYVQMFADVTAKYGDLYYRDFKEGVGDHPELMQADRDHPTAKGDAVIVARMLPMVKMLLAQAKQP